MFGSSPWLGELPSDVREVPVEGMSRPGLVHGGGLLLCGCDNRWVNVQKLQSEETGKMTSACKYGQADDTGDLELSESELALVEQLRVRSFFNGAEPGMSISFLFVSNMYVHRVLTG